MHILCLENDTKRYKCIFFLGRMNHDLEYFCIVLNNLLEEVNITTKPFNILTNNV